MNSKFKQILIDEGITQAELSRKSGVAQGSINRFVNGNKKPSPVTKSKIIKAINEYIGKEKYNTSDAFSDK